jgi:hypothetical protein
MASSFIVNNRYQISWNSAELCQVLGMEMLIVLVLQREVQWRRPLFRSTFSNELLLLVLTHMHGSDQNKASCKCNSTGLVSIVGIEQMTMLVVPDPACRQQI